MGEIVNLRRVKKQRARDAVALEAAENRARHGMTKAAKQLEAKRRRLAKETLDGAALPPSPDPLPPAGEGCTSGSGDGEAGEVSG